MKVSPYMQFNGNCAAAIEFYEKAFSVKAEVYKKDDDFIDHAKFDFGDGWIGLSDTPPDEEKSTFGKQWPNCCILPARKSNRATAHTVVPRRSCFPVPNSTACSNARNQRRNRKIASDNISVTPLANSFCVQSHNGANF